MKNIKIIYNQSHYNNFREICVWVRKSGTTHIHKCTPHPLCLCTSLPCADTHMCMHTALTLWLLGALMAEQDQARQGRGLWLGSIPYVHRLDLVGSSFCAAPPRLCQSALCGQPLPSPLLLAASCCATVAVAEAQGLELNHRPPCYPSPPYSAIPVCPTLVPEPQPWPPPPAHPTLADPHPRQVEWHSAQPSSHLQPAQEKLGWARMGGVGHIWDFCFNSHLLSGMPGQPMKSRTVLPNHNIWSSYL